MRRYKHWLVIDQIKSIEDERELIKELIMYRINHECDIKVFYRDSGSFDTIYSLETFQDYNNLDLPCNSGSNSFRRLTRKPSNIHESKRSFDELVNIKLKSVSQ